MKKILKLMAGTVLCATLLPISAYAGNNDIRDAYKKLLDKSAEFVNSNSDYYNSGYFLSDINKDGTPELFIVNFTEVWGDVYIYTYKNGQVIKCFEDTSEQYNKFIIDKTNSFVGMSGGTGAGELYEIYTMENNISLEKTNDILYFGDYPGHEEYVYTYNDKYISNDDVNAKYDFLFPADDCYDSSALYEYFNNLPDVNNSGITITVNGSVLDAPQAPYIENDTTMVPMRAIFEALGADVEYFSDTKSVIATKDGKAVELTTGSDIMVSDGVSTTLANSVVIKDGTMMIPLRAVSSALGASVDWNGDTKSITITY